MRNKQNKAKICFFCKTPNVNNIIEVTFSKCDLCYKCEKPLEERFPTKEKKEYLNEKQCNFCVNKLTRLRLIKNQLPVCQNCNDNYHKDSQRDISILIARKNEAHKDKTLGHLCICCDLRYNRLTEKELKH